MVDKEPEMKEIVKKPTESQIMQFDKDIRGLSKVLTKGLKPIFNEKFEVEKVAPKENLFQKYDTMKNQVPKDLELVFTFLVSYKKSSSSVGYINSHTLLTAGAVFPINTPVTLLAVLVILYNL